MPAYWRASEVRVIEEHPLWVRFKDGLEDTVRFLPGFFRGVFSHLNDPEKIRQVTVVGGAVTWPSKLDLAPDAMHEEIKQRGGEWAMDK